jgi:hypothetical protein
MPQCLVQFASMTIALHTKYAYTAALCAPYAAPAGAKADFSVSVTDEEIAREAGRGTETYPEQYLESLAIYRRICHEALAYDTFLFHGSALSCDGAGYLFTAPSGTGKSTHARLWREVYGARVQMINDDKPLLRLGADGVRVCGTPWDGKHHLSTNVEVPLRAICILTRGKDNAIERISRAEAYPYLLAQTYRPQDPGDLARTLTLLDRVAAGVRLYRLTCTPSPEAAVVAGNAMLQGD